MELKFTNPGIDYMINSIIEFQKDDQTPFWSDSLYYFYKGLDKEYAKTLEFQDRKNYIEKVLRETYEELEETINNKIVVYSKHWETHKPKIEAALSDAFKVDCKALFNDMVCKVSMNPVSPRFLQENSFEVFYLNSEKGALGTAVHEIIHFVWFYVWNQVFNDSYEEYESPSLKWILSEMVVESVMRDPRLSTINPYFPRENGGCIYPYFFDMEVNGKLVLDVLEEMYRTQDIKEFMKNSYEYCLNNEAEIRKHIETAERG